MRLHGRRAVYLAVLTLAAAGNPLRAAERERLVVAIAANLDAVMSELKGLYETAHPGETVEIVSGASGKLAAQVLNGAPYDVFLSADMENPRKLWDAGYAVAPPVGYAQGVLVMFTAGDLDLAAGPAVAALPVVRKVSVADPRLSPYGKAAIEALTKTGRLDPVLPKIVTANSVSDVVLQTCNGADLGFTARSLMYAEGMKRYNAEGKHWVEVDASLYGPLRQGMVVLAHGRGKPGARRFYDFILSGAARKVFERYGYRQ